MGLDVALGVVILIAAIRGWLQGFVYQFIRIAGLIACVYLAAPVRDQVKPHVVTYLPSIRPDLVDRLLWWVSASVTYIVIVGVATLVTKMTRRPEMPGVPAQRSRNDQFAGFLLGIAKGGLIAAFVVAGLEKYAAKQIETIPWASKQAMTSRALAWNGQYRPAARVWDSVPVQHFVNHVRRMGLLGPATAPDSASPDEDGVDAFPVVQTARRAPNDTAAGTGHRTEAESTPPAPPAPATPTTTGTHAKADPKTPAPRESARPN